MEPFDRSDTARDFSFSVRDDASGERRIDEYESLERDVSARELPSSPERKPGTGGIRSGRRSRPGGATSRKHEIEVDNEAK
ncbi:hypothetical protein KM043_003892 [Ampulex compressa]|nr:hypothetical protein KM043_003892 [Ampulex compressa]